MAEDAREDWLLQQVAMAFKAVTAVTPEKFNAFFRAEKTVGALDQARAALSLSAAGPLAKITAPRRAPRASS